MTDMTSTSNEESKMTITTPTKLTYWERLANAKDEFPPFVKDTEGYGYSYVTLDSIQKVLHPILSKHDLLLVHSLTFRDGVYGVHSVLLSSNGELPTSGALDSFFPVNHQAKPQDVGSARTYGTRYNITTMFDLILVGEDDDGRAAQGEPKGKTKGRASSNTKTAAAKKVVTDDTDW